MNEQCPLGSQEVWDDAIPDACLRCWVQSQNSRLTHTGATLYPDEFRAGGRYRMEHSIQRANTVGRRVITELMVLSWDDTEGYSGHVTRKVQSEVDCLREAPQ